MPTEIDSLQIKIETQSSNASKGIDDLVKSLNKLSTALSPLSDRLSKLSSNFSAVPNVAKKSALAVDAYATSAKKGKKETEGFANILDDLRTKMGALSVVAHTVGNTVGKWIKNASDYEENVNLFTVSMGEYAEEAMTYAERINDLMKIDTSEFIRNQGIFMSMATGFGVAEDQAYALSKGLTELSYDIASFFNPVGGIEEAFLKVRSGIAGELEPLRALGYALSEASLQEVAHAHGIDLSIEKMTEAQKTMLRYTAIVEQSRDMGAIGDMARTLVTPANAMRILKQQLTELSRALGQLFIPILMKVLPYLQAFVEVITTAVRRLAEFFGYELQQIDYSGLDKVSESVVDTSTGLGEAAENAKKLKSQMLGIDELNVISQDDSSSAGAGGAGGNGYGSDLGLDVASIWDESILSQIENDIDELIPKMETFAKIVGTLAGAFAAIKVGGWIKTIAGFLGDTKLFTNGKAFVDLLREGSGLLPTFSAAFPGLSGFLTTLGGGSLAVGLGVAAAAIVAIGSAIYYAVENFDLIKKVAKNFFDEQIAPKIDEIKESFRHMGEVLQPVADFLKPAVEWVKKFVTETLGIKSVADVFEAIGAVVFHVLGSVIGGAFNSIMSIIKGFVYMFEGLVDIVAGVIGVIVSLFKGDLNGAWEATVQIFEGIAKVFHGLWDATVGAVVEFVDGVIGWFTALWDELVGHSIVPDTIDAIVDWFASLPDKILSGLKQFCDDVAQKFKDMWESIKSWYTANVAPKFTKDYWLGVFNNIKLGAVQMLDAVKSTLSTKWEGIKNWFSTTIKPWFTVEKWASIFSGIKDGLISAITSALNKAVDKLNEFIGWINDKMNFTIPGFSIGGGSIDIPEWLGGGTYNIPSVGWSSREVTLLSLPTISRFADGGFIEDGLFTMNHGEIAGKFSNGKSVVANNEQIIAGISEGVYSAVVAAMRNAGGGSGEQNVNVYLDGKQIYTSVKKTESERGKQLFGNQLGYNF